MSGTDTTTRGTPRKRAPGGGRKPSTPLGRAMTEAERQALRRDRYRYMADALERIQAAGSLKEAKALAALAAAGLPLPVPAAQVEA